MEIRLCIHLIGVITRKNPSKHISKSSSLARELGLLSFGFAEISLKISPAVDGRIPTLKALRIVHSIVRVRGLLRWSLTRYLNNYDENYFYELSRYQIVVYVFKNWKFVAERLLPHFSIYNPTPFYESEKSDFLDHNVFITLKSGINVINNLNSNEIPVIFERPTFLLIPNFLKIRKIKEYLIETINKERTYLKATDFLKVILAASSYDYSRLTLEIDEVNHFRDEIASNNIIELHKAEIWHQRFIIHNSKLRIFDATADPRLPFVAGLWNFYSHTNTKNLIDIDKPSGKFLHIREGVFLCGRADENWFHFIFDCVLRIMSARDLPQHIPFLIRDDLPDSCYKLLKSLTSRKIILIKQSIKYSVQSLYVVAGRSVVFDSKPIYDDKRVLFPSNLFEIAGLIRSKLQLDEAVHVPQKIVITRKSSSRLLLNETKVFGILNRCGFALIESDRNFFVNQSKIFYTSDFIAAAGGAVLANLIFARPGSKVLVFRSWRNSKVNLWTELCSLLNIEIAEIIGIPSYYGLNSQKRSHSNFYVPISKVKSFLRFNKFSQT